jgi:hypothetical protein
MRSDLRRKIRTRNERPRVLIVSEGEKTEPEYFRGLTRHLRATGADVYAVTVVGHGRDPLRVVKEATRRRDSAKIEDPYDVTWCVVDVDDHQTLNDAIELARREGIKIAISNACFEVWLLWHFTDARAYSTPRQLQEVLKQHGCGGKAMPSGFDYALHSVAASRAQASDPDAASWRIGLNPSTAVHLVIAELRP